MRLAAAVDDADDPHEAALRRIALPLAKFWVCKRTPMMVAEALECLGGNGYVEESGMPLLFRESPLNSMWEGSGNVNALDVLRALSREPEALNAWIVEVGRARGEDPHLDRAIESVLESLADTSELEVGARRLAGRMAACLQGALLVQHAPAAVADAFCATRLGTEYGGTLGTLPRGIDLASIVDPDHPPRLTAHPATSGAPEPRPPGDSGAPRPGLRRRPRRGDARRSIAPPDAPGRQPRSARQTRRVGTRSPPDAPGQRGWAERWEAAHGERGERGGRHRAGHLRHQVDPDARPREPAVDGHPERDRRVERRPGDPADRQRPDQHHHADRDAVEDVLLLVRRDADSRARRGRSRT